MTSEVLAPGGSLDHALWALEGGADAVYVGFQKFSARSHADNLTLDDMALLTAAARDKGARIYCALNTILGPQEVLEAVALAWELHFRGVHALIVQDLGLALALKRHGPPLALHASTQAAVHNAGGVAAMKALGFCRVVLARELTLAEIAALVAADPSMEYEVFVHGALCYAVSGNCMASGLMLGRSANRGDCGQVCRTKFELDYLIPGPQRRSSPHEEGLVGDVHAPPGEITWKAGLSGTFTSMNDLELGSRIRELRQAGVLSFKIEGRMKPPAYAYNTARAYKAFLEGGRDKEAWEWLDEARLRFGRLPSPGWLDGHKAQAQINPTWAGSLGMPLGDVSGKGDKAVTVETGTRASVFRSLAKGDGLMILGVVPGQTFRGALDGPAEVRGTQTELKLADKVPFDPLGGSLWLLSRHDGKLPVKKAGKVWRHPLAMTLDLEAVPGTPSVRITVFCPDFDASLTEDLDAQQARGDGAIEATLTDIFRASDSRFVPGEFRVKNNAGRVFISPKVLKDLRRRWFTLVEKKASEFVAELPGRLKVESVGAAAPQRSHLSPLTGVNARTGFIVDWEGLRADQLANTPDGLALPLAPFTPNEASYLRRFRAFLVRMRNEGLTQRLVPGLNNPGHLTWVRILREEGFNLPVWFADWAFHTSTPWTTAQLSQALPGMAFAIGWLEADGADTSYFPPLFTSRACMLRNSFGDPEDADWLRGKLGGRPGAPPVQGPKCPADCAGHFSARLVQGKKAFRVEARDCINYLILEKE